MDDLDDIEQLRIAALQTLHQKKSVPVTTPITCQPSGYVAFPDEPVSSFPGYNTRNVQLSPRSVSRTTLSIIKDYEITNCLTFDIYQSKGRLCRRKHFDPEKTERGPRLGSMVPFSFPFPFAEIQGS